MARLTPQQIGVQKRFEGLIALIAPALDLLLLGGDRVARLTEPSRDEDWALRPAGSGSSRRVTRIGR